MSTLVTRRREREQRERIHILYGREPARENDYYIVLLHRLPWDNVIFYTIKIAIIFFASGGFWRILDMLFYVT